MPKSKTSNKINSNPFSACDDLIVRYKEGKVWFLSVELKLDPWKGFYALPGAAMKIDENLDDTMKRVYFEITGDKPLYAEQLYTFSDLKRDSRARSISTSYIVIPKHDLGEFKLRETFKYANVVWKELKKPGKLAFDHNEMVKMGLERISNKLLYSTLGLLLLPKEFTLTELQNLYEYCVGQALDKRNFRKKILSLGIVAETGKMRTGVKSRPAMLYKAKSLKMEIINFLG